MLASFLITFREALEAALIIGIIAAYVAKIGRKDLNRYIYAGIIGAVIASIGVAFVFKSVYGELQGTAEQLFKGMHSLDVTKFFKYTSVLLILFSTGLIATVVGGFNEAGIIPPLVEHVWDLNPSLNPDGSYPLLHENGLIGGGLISLIGYWMIMGVFVYRSFKVPREVR